MRAGTRAGTRSREKVLRKKPRASGRLLESVREPNGERPEGGGSTQIQWPRQRISEKSLGVIWLVIPIPFRFRFGPQSVHQHVHEGAGDLLGG